MMCEWLPSFGLGVLAGLVILFFAIGVTNTIVWLVDWSFRRS